MRLRARRLEAKRGAVKPHDGKDVDHRLPISKGGGNDPSNFRVESAHRNRSFPRTHRGAIKMADGGLVGGAAEALKNRQASMDAQIDAAVKPPPAAPKPVVAAPAMPVDPLTAQLNAQAAARAAAPPPPKPSLIDRMKKAIGMKDGGYVWPEDNNWDDSQSSMDDDIQNRTQHMQAGGPVPGQGSGDKVPIMGEPGEFMMPKDSVQKIGVAKLEAMRKATHNKRGAVKSRGMDESLFH